jgi:hypothetical protein
MNQLRICLECDEPYIAKNEWQKYCGATCGRIAQSRRYCEWKKTNPARKSKKAPNCICPFCGIHHYRKNSHKWRYCHDHEEIIKRSPDFFAEPDCYSVGYA